MLTGVEIAQAKAGVVYLTSISLSGGPARFLVSPDRGVTWTGTTIPLPSKTEPRILTVDRADEKKVYLRVVDAVSDSMMMTDDSGQSFRTISLPSGPSSLPSSGPATAPSTPAPGPASCTCCPPERRTSRCRTRLIPMPGQRPGSARIYACTDLVTDGTVLPPATIRDRPSSG